MNNISQFAEYSVEKKQSKAFYALRVACPIITFILSMSLFCVAVINYGFIISLIPGLAVIIVSVWYSVRTFRTVQYDYRITDGEMYFSVIYNKRKRKELLNLEIARLEAIAPYRDQYRESADRLSYTKVFDLTSSADSPYIYYAVLPDEEDRSDKTIIFFEPSEKMLKLLKLYNRSTVIPRSKVE